MWVIPALLRWSTHFTINAVGCHNLLIVILWWRSCRRSSHQVGCAVSRCCCWWNTFSTSLSWERWISMCLRSLLVQLLLLMMLLHQGSWRLRLLKLLVADTVVATYQLRLWHSQVSILALCLISIVSIARIGRTQGLHSSHSPCLSNSFSVLGGLCLRCPLFISHAYNNRWIWI